MNALIQPAEVLLLLLSTLLLPALEAQRIEVQPKVTGYTNDDVTLHCRFIRGAEESKVDTVQWNLVSTGNKTQEPILVFNVNHGTAVKETPLKGRVNISGESDLIIRKVQMSDAGTYKCSVTAFPYGVFEESIQLEVEGQKEQMKLELVAVIVVVVLVLFIILAATVYLVSTRRFPCRQRGVQQVHVTTAAQLNHDVVYTDVKRKEDGRPARGNAKTHHRDDVIDSKVVQRGQRHKQEEDEGEEMVI
ncbi:nectin 1a-like [Synchiropus picturatus]